MSILKAIIGQKRKYLLTERSFNLFGILTRAYMKLSEQNSFVSMAWSFVGPMSLLAVMYYVFSSRFGHGIEAYPLYLLIGIVCVSFFVTSTSSLAGIFISHKAFILNTTVPREIIFFARFFSHILKFTIEIVICLVISVIYQLIQPRTLWLLLPLYVSFVLFVAGVSLFLVVLYVFFRDVQHIWTLASRLMFFMSPIFFRLDSLPPRIQMIAYFFNPITPFLISFRGVMMDTAVNGWIYLHSLALGVFFFLTSYIVFIFFEHSAMEKA